LVHGGYEAADPIAGIGSIIILLDTILFGYFVFRRDGIADPHAGNPRYSIANNVDSAFAGGSAQ
jgi:hypothetical protein